MAGLEPVSRRDIPGGETGVETRGFVGPDCRESGRFVEQALGSTTAERLTAECHQGQSLSRDLRQGT